MQLIGTDLSIDVCKDEGYMMVEVPDDFNEFDPELDYKLIRYNPKYAREESIWLPDIKTEVHSSFNELKDIYLRNKKALDSFASIGKSINFESPTIYDFLHLADSIEMYQGF